MSTSQAKPAATENTNMLKHRVKKYEERGTVSCGDGSKEIIESGNIKDLIPESLESLEEVDLIREDFEGSKIKCSTRKESLEEDLKNVWNILNRKYKNQIHDEKELVYVNVSKASRNSSVASENFFNSSCEKSQKSFNSSSMLTLTESASKKKCNISWQNGNLSTNAVPEPWSSQRKKKMEDFDYKIYEEVEFKKIFPTKRKLEVNENVISEASENFNYSRFSDSWKRGIRKIFRKKFKLSK